MLSPFIIEQIRRRELEDNLRREADRPRLQIPLDAYRPAPEHEEEPEVQRGVVVLDL